MKINCDNCGKEFDKRPSQMKRSKSGKHYCSRSCSQTANNKGIARNKPKEFECRKCGKTYTRNKNWRSEVFCSVECREASRISRDDATLEELHETESVKGRHPSWKNSHVRHHCKRVNAHKRKLGCAVCGYDKHVELAHIKPISEFDSSATLAEINADSNVIQLCPNHHWEFDNLGLDITPFISSTD